MVKNTKDSVKDGGRAEQNMEQIVSLAKRRGFIYPGSEIYGGFSGFWDYGPLGTALKRNIEHIWWKMFVEDRDDMYSVDSAIIMNPKAWEASGHAGGFSDPMVECKRCKRRFRRDPAGSQKYGECLECGGSFGETRHFNMMFRTQVGATEDESSVAYLRPETAGGIFVNFKNIVDSFHPKLPFGVAQIGKAFRNEISPRDFVFRSREFEQMEIEYFVREQDWKENFEMWREESLKFIANVGISRELVHELEVSPKDRAHYSKRTIDFEFDFSFGRKELFGLAYRTDFDLRRHETSSGVELKYLEEGGNKFTPHVIEPSFGIERIILAILQTAYAEDELGGERRTYLKFNPAVAPVKAAVFPLLKNKPQLVDKARGIYENLKKQVPQIVWDDNGNIGKRYRRQDEIGTPACITIDFQTLEDNTVTVRDRDTGKQERVQTSELSKLLGTS